MLITNYITSAWRNILRHKLFSIINILGLAIGLAAVMLIALYVRYETSYDSFWKDANNIYRLHMTIKPPGQETLRRVITPAPVIVSMKEKMPEIEIFARMGGGMRNVTLNNETFQEAVSFVDPEIVDIFDIEVIGGNLKESLSSLSGLVLDQSLAEKYFGTDDPIGQVMTIEGSDFKRDFTVSAIIKNLPENSKFFAKAMVKLDSADWESPSVMDNWFSPRYHSFFKLRKDANIDEFNNKLPEFIEHNYPQSPNVDFKITDIVSLSAMNIKELHLNAVGMGEYRSHGDLTAVISFSTVALLILVIASVNFMNLSTARANQRAKEIGMRKVMGAGRKNLIVQFIGESVLITIIGMFLAMALVEFCLPFYNDFIGQNLVIDYLSDDLTILLSITIIVGVIGGIYPALVLSSFRPSKVLKTNKSVNSTDRSTFRTLLVTLQFTISILLFVSTATIYGQMNYIENLDLGYSQNNLINFSGNRSPQLAAKIDILQSRISNIDGVQNVSWTTNFQPGSMNEVVNGFRVENSGVNERTALVVRPVGYNFFNTYEIPIMNGRDFSRSNNDERTLREELISGSLGTGGVILNQQAVKSLSFSSNDDAMGKTVLLATGQDPNDNSKILEIPLTVIGIVGDVQFRNLKTAAAAEVFLLNTRNPQYISVRVNDYDQYIIEQVRTIWNEELPDVPFNYRIATDALINQYLKEQNQMTMFAAFSALAIFIACLGLFGLASFTAERRTKEIGIRKVFGAEVFQIVKLLVWQFSKPVLIANIIAWPIAYLAMSRWLESFVYRIDDMVIIALCLIAGLTALLIAWATVAGNSYAVARQNPIKALRYE